MRDAGNADTFGEVPLLLTIDGRFAPTQRPQLRLHPLAGFPVLAVDGDRAIELQIADVIALLAGDMVEDLRVGEVTVEGKIAWDRLIDHPIDQLFAQNGMILEGCFVGHTGLLLAEAAELQRIVFARGTHVIGDQIVMGDQMPLIGMIPEPAGIFNQLAVMGDQRVINRDHAVRGVVGGRVALQPIEAPLVEQLFIPLDLGDPAVQAGLVSRDGKLPVDPTDGFAFRNKQAGQILSEVLAFGLVGKQIRVLGQEVLHNRREFNNRWHTRSWW